MTACHTCAIRLRGACDIMVKDNMPGPDVLPRTHHTADAKRNLVRVGEPVKDIIVICEGIAFRHRILASGQRQILSFVMPGEVVSAAMAVTPLFSYMVQALTPVRYCSIPRNDLYALMTNGSSRELSHQMSNAALREKWRSDELIVDLGTRDALGRIVHMLLLLHARLAAAGLEQDGWIDLPLRRVHMAEATGITTVHVGRVLHRLKADGLVVFEGNRIRLPNREALAALADLRIDDLNPPRPEAA
jgi:CRP-like cAMP-binding protein